MIKPTYFFLTSNLADLKATGKELDGAKVGLFLTGTPGPQAITGDFEEPTYAGYAQQTLAAADWGNPYLSNGSLPTLSAKTLTFRPTDGTVSTVVKGWFLTNATGGLLFSEMFDTAVPLVDQNSALLLGVEVSVGADGAFGSAAVQW
jgi:hypothetical protein